MNTSEMRAELRRWSSTDAEVARACVLALRSRGVYSLGGLTEADVENLYATVKVMIDELPVERLAWE